MEKKAYISSEKAKIAATRDSILTTKKDNRATRAADVIASVGSGKGPKSVSTSNSTTIIDKSNSGNTTAGGGMGGSGGSGGRSGSSSTSGSSSGSSSDASKKRNVGNTNVEIEIKKKNKEKTTVIQPDYHNYKKGGATYKKGGSIKRKK
jgi:hypothetical protein